jgi:hypothetical protein
MDEQINWDKAFNGNNINSLPIAPHREPKIDKVVSDIVGKNVYVSDKRLLDLIVKWKKECNPEEDNHFLEQERYINELKEVFK